MLIQAYLKGHLAKSNVSRSSKLSESVNELPDSDESKHRSIAIR